MEGENKQVNPFGESQTILPEFNLFLYDECSAGESANLPKMTPNPTQGKAKKAVPRISCFRCRKRHIRCNREDNCDQCIAAKQRCVRVQEEKGRPPSPRYTRALEAQVAFLEIFLEKLGKASHEERDEMLTDYLQKAGVSRLAVEGTASATKSSRGRDLALRHKGAGNSLVIWGPGSVVPMNPPVDQGNATGIMDVKFEAQITEPPGATPPRDWEYELDAENNVVVHNLYTPDTPLCQQLMAAFFHYQYTDHMCLYREYFLRDYKNGGGPHYSDLLMFAICSMGALAKTPDNLTDLPPEALSDLFSKKAQTILYDGGALESPNLTTLQALLLLGHRDIGRGKSSKGWLFTGIAFRLAHEMGLHLDPDRWKTAHDSDVEREILRRVYWAAFVADKQLSLYFGRPPALRPSEADVNGTVRILYPPEWNELLGTFIQGGVTENEYEDGPNLVRGFQQQVELSKIVYTMITEVFENRSSKTDDTILAVAARSVGAALERWLGELPNSLHWNIHTRGTLPPYIIHLHLFFHTIMIVLHRPPRQSDLEYLASAVEDLEVCNQSVESILQLLRVQKRSGGYNMLPATSVHTLASAASIVLLKLYMEGPQGKESETAQQLDQILAGLDGISSTWASAKQIRAMVDQAIGGIRGIHDQNDYIDWDWEENYVQNNGMAWINEEQWEGLVGPGFPAAPQA